METEDIDQCRICLETAEEMIDLFEDSKTLYKLELCCGVEIPNIPSLPSKICKKCSDILKVAYGFRVLCQRSQEYLSDPHNIVDLIEDKPNLSEEKVSATSPKLELEIEYAEKEETYNEEEKFNEVEEGHHDGDDHHGDDNHDNYDESVPEDQCQDNNKAVEEDEDDDKPLIKYFPARTARKPKSPITLMCNICGNLFRNKATFSYHMKLHRNDKKYVCEICSKRFMQTCELRAHIRVHTGEKPYNCSYCDRKFRDRSGVTRHERTHTNERPYGCTICGAHFSYSATLKKHERVHTGEKPYRCLVCDKGFSEAHQMKAHFGTIRHAEMAKERSKVENLE
ncbi:transcription factor Ouib-like [Episyrphus balteatus]|uniref:transcription factor Ouib-like n=1 Tax=Episyrphus balteatus TaxID=286459 RepID=UPI0024868019|nr:transcription factor Ouib-like [Episyrphus balteatus]